MKEDETIVQDLEAKGQPDSAPPQDGTPNEGEETAIKDDVMKVESISSLAMTTVDRSAPNTLSEPAAPPGLDTTLVLSGSQSRLPLQPALDNRGGGLGSELKSQSASIVATDDKASLAPRATHSQTDMDGVEVTDLKTVNQVSSKEEAEPPAKQPVNSIGEGTDAPQLDEEKTASKNSLKKVESEPKIEDSPAAPTSEATDSTPFASGESPPVQSPDNTDLPTEQTDKPSQKDNDTTTTDPPPVKEPCDATTGPPPVKEPCDATTGPPPVKEPCDATTDPHPPPVKEPCDATTDPPPVKEPCDATTGPPPVKEPCDATTDPPPVKEPCDATTGPPPVKEPCDATTDPPPVKEPCNATTDPPPVKEPCDATTDPPPVKEPCDATTDPPVKEPCDATTGPPPVKEPCDATTGPPLVKEPCDATTDPPPVKEPCDATTDPPPVKEPCDATTGPPPVKEPCDATTGSPPVKEPCTETKESNKLMGDENSPQNSEDNESTPPDSKERHEEGSSNLKTEPTPKSSPTLSKRTEDSDSRKIDHSTGQSSAVELDSTETTPITPVHEVPATV